MSSRLAHPTFTCIIFHSIPFPSPPHTHTPNQTRNKSLISSSISLLGEIFSLNMLAAFAEPITCHRTSTCNQQYMSSNNHVLNFLKRGSNQGLTETYAQIPYRLIPNMKNLCNQPRMHIKQCYKYR